MPCTITNITNSPLNVPVVNTVLRPGEQRIFEYIERDIVLNDPRVNELVRKNRIIVKGPYDAAWNTKECFRMEPYQIWVDENDHLRMIEGCPTHDTDGLLVGGDGASPRELVQDQVVYTSNKTFAQVRHAFWGWWPDPTMADWDTYWKYCLWSMAAVNDGFAPEWSSPIRFTSEDEFFTYMEENLPTSGDRFQYSTAFRIYDEVDVTDTYPDKLVFRNSLVASMAGRKRWSRKGNYYYGVDGNFDIPMYYVNFYNELGRRFVNAATGVTPPTNNNDCIWYPLATKGLWHWPVAGAGAAFQNSRGAVWDNVTSNWVSPAPVTFYTFQDPFLLYEYKKSRTLAIYKHTGAPLRELELDSVAAWVFPAVAAGRYWGFMVYPHCADSWSTSWHDTSEYKVTLKLRYPGTYRSRYVEIDPTASVFTNQQRQTWNIFDQSGAGSLLLRKQKAGYATDIDNNCIPTKVYISRRNVETGLRSKWRPLLDVKRRLNNATFRVVPAT